MIYSCFLSASLLQFLIDQMGELLDTDGLRISVAEAIARIFIMKE